MFGQLFQAGLASEYSALNLRRIMSTEFTKTVCGDSLLEQLSIRSMILLLKIEGNCSHLRAKSAYFVGHLPTIEITWRSHSHLSPRELPFKTPTPPDPPHTSPSPPSLSSPSYYFPYPSPSSHAVPAPPPPRTAHDSASTTSPAPRVSPPR
jgi:hypothetical protein